MYVTRAAFAPRRPMQGLGRLRRPHHMGAINPLASRVFGPVPKIPSFFSTVATPAPTTTTTAAPTSTPRQRRQWTQGQQAQQTQQGRQRWRQNQNQQNATGAPSTIQSYDAAGNPVYAVPPAGQAITGYDQYGNPIYGGAASASTFGPAAYGYGAGSALQTSATAATAGATAGFPTNPTNGQTYVDSSGNTWTYSSASGWQETAAASTAAAATDTSGYQSILDWLSESTLISGFPNWGVAAVVGLGAVWLMNRQSRGR